MLKTLVGGFANPGSFITLWKTDNAGSSSSSQVTWPTSAAGTYNCTVYWGDGTSNVITTYTDPAWTHTYPVPGTYRIIIVGTFRGIFFNSTGDRLKLLNISQWGGFSFGNTGAYFAGCTNLTITAPDTPGLVGTISFTSAFNGCASITLVPGMDSWNMSSITAMNAAFNGCNKFVQDIGSWNTSSVTNMGNMMNQCLVFNRPIGNWNTSAVTSFNSMFSGSTSINQNFGSWNITSLTTASSMFNAVTMTNANYNGLLAGWGAQLAKNNVTFSGGNSHYDSFSGGFNGTAGRAVLTGTYTWTITDGGTP